MTTNSPFDFSDMMKMFDAEQVSRMFDPGQMQKAMSAFKAPGFDVQAIMDSNKKNFEAMLAANKAAASAYQDFYKMQMSIFEEMMQGARDHVASLGSATGTDAAQKQAEIYRAAAEKALANMTVLAEAARKANQEAYSIIEGRVKESIEELKSM